ncbi:MAG: hypothetical protein LBL66_07245 [Clostridiales bacterium]|nr:hypothetical protein [Clostridiales bacterium]
MGAQYKDREGAGIPLFGRDCRVALRVPRNDKSGVRALRNDTRGRAPRNRVVAKLKGKRNCDGFLGQA